MVIFETTILDAVISLCILTGFWQKEKHDTKKLLEEYISFWFVSMQ